MVKQAVSDNARIRRKSLASLDKTCRGPFAPRFKKSSSASAILGHRKRIHKKTGTCRPEVDTADLLKAVSQVARVHKLDASQIDHEIASGSRQCEHEYLPATRRPEASRVKTPEGARSKRPIPKSNRSGNIKPLHYASDRTKLQVPCFAEDEAMRIEPPLRSMYHKGVKEEDLDSDDNVVEAGKQRALKLLTEGLKNATFRKGGRSPIPSERSPPIKSKALLSRERTRRNSSCDISK